MSEANILYERYRFYQRCQQSEETLQAFVDDVFVLAKTCELEDHWDSLVRDRVVFGMHDEAVKWQIINRGGNPTLADVLSSCNLYAMHSGIELDEQPYHFEQCQPFEFAVTELDDRRTKALSDLPNKTESADDMESIKPRTSMAPEDIQHQQVAPNPNDVDVECPVCHRMIRAENFALHVDQHNSSLKVVKIVCHNCSATFESYHALNGHYADEHTFVDPETSRTKYTCSRCDTSYVKLAKLRNHLTHKHGQPSARIFECRACDASFTEMHKIDKHIRIHTTCDVCGVCCRTVSALRLHQLGHAKIDEPFECFVCHSKHRTVHYLRGHMKYAHAVERYACPSCSAVFPQRPDLVKHMRKHRPADGCRCEVCYRSFESQHDYDEHIVQHPQCDVCGKIMRTAMQLKRHRISHSGLNPFECFQCHRTFQTFDQTYKHYHKAHSHAAHAKRADDKRREQPKDHLCAQCGASFSRSKALLMHMTRRDHRKDGGSDGVLKPFECDVCQKRFRHATAFKDHYRHHTGELPYSCEFCGKSFRSTTAIGEHRRGVHLERDRHKCQLCDFKCFKLSAFKKHSRMHALVENGVQKSHLHSSKRKKQNKI